MPPPPDPEKIIPQLAGHARLGVDPVTRCSVLLYPEGILELDEIAAAILRLCDGRRTLGQIAQVLADEYEASRREIFDDTQEFLAGLIAKGLLRPETDPK